MKIQKKKTIVAIIIAIWTLLQLLLSDLKESLRSARPEWTQGETPWTPLLARVAPLHPACGQLSASKKVQKFYFYLVKIKKKIVNNIFTYAYFKLHRHTVTRKFKLDTLFHGGKHSRSAVSIPFGSIPFGSLPFGSLPFWLYFVILKPLLCVSSDIVFVFWFSSLGSLGCNQVFYKDTNLGGTRSSFASADAAALWPERELGHSGLKGRPPEPPFLQGLHPCTLLVDSY